MVVTGLSPTALTGIWQDRTGCPSRCTVQAPHSAMPQPNLVPVSPSVSRSTHSSGCLGFDVHFDRIAIDVELGHERVSPRLLTTAADYMPVAVCL